MALSKSHVQSDDVGAVTRAVSLAGWSETDVVFAVIAGVQPLDACTSLKERRNAPADIARLLFADPKPLLGPAAESLVGDAGDWAAYALLDAAMVPNLPELLETSGLEHQCLFVGDLKDELGAVAPWVVRLDPEAALTRHLFTRGEAGWYMWDRWPGLLVRST